MTTTERVADIEGMNRLVSIEEQQTQLLARHESRITKLEELHAEQREDSKKVQRLWVSLAKKHGWIDDEDNF